jgi:multimeric flavodoxin WrbA
MNRRDFVKLAGLGAMAFLVSKNSLFVTDKNTVSAQENVSGGKKMKIVVIAGSPHKAGTSALLADKFIEGAESKGHECFRFNAAFEDTHPCLGCDHCGMNGPCVYNDAISTKLMPKMLEADMIVLATPLYYFGMSAQIKTVIDRFYSRTGSLHNKKSILMATAWDSNNWTMEALVHHYETLVKYMQWKDCGKILAVGCGTRSMIERSDFPQQAYKLGASI